MHVPSESDFNWSYINLIFFAPLLHANNANRYPKLSIIQDIQVSFPTLLFGLIYREASVPSSSEVVLLARAISWIGDI